MLREVLRFHGGGQRVESSRTGVGIGLAACQRRSDLWFESCPKAQQPGGLNVKRQSHCETKRIAPEQIETLVIQLSGRVRLLDSDIEAEEERTRCKDRRETGYSILARTLIARRDNLSATITALRERLAALEAPE